MVKSLFIIGLIVSCREKESQYSFRKELNKMRIRQVNFKVSDVEREILNSLITKKGCSLSDVIREAVKEHYDLEEFNASYTETANKRYKSKWEIY